MIRAGYALLDLITFLTAGPKEARPRTITYDDFVACGGGRGAKDAGKMRLEGPANTVRDGDITHFRFDV